MAADEASGHDAPSPPQGPAAQLADKVDTFFARVRERYPDALQCGAGCASCCHQHLGLFAHEFARVARAVVELPEATQRAVYERALATRDSSPRCPLLDAEARCVVYSARPIICRSHGVPVRTGERRDVCPLNFKDAPLETIDDDCVLDLEHTNAILSVIDQLMTPGQDRVDLVGGLTQLLAP